MNTLFSQQNKMIKIESFFFLVFSFFSNPLALDQARTYKYPGLCQYYKAVHANVKNYLCLIIFTEHLQNCCFNAILR